MLRFNSMTLSGCFRFRWDTGWAFVVFAIIEMAVAMATTVVYFEGGDTQTYVWAWERELANGIVSSWRVPVYPSLIGLCKWLTGAIESGFVLLSFFQWGVFIVSVRYFWKVALRLVRGKYSRMFSMALYVFVCPIPVLNLMMQTESLMISCLVFFLYAVVEAYYRCSVKYTVWSTLWAVVLMMLKPGMVYLPVATAILWGALLLFTGKGDFCGRRWRKVAQLGLCGACVAGLFMLGYVGMVVNTHGMHTPVRATLMNDYYAGRKCGWITRESIKDPRISVHIENEKVWWGEMTPFLDSPDAMPLGDFEAVVDSIYAVHRDELPSMLLRRAMDSAHEDLLMDVYYFDAPVYWKVWKWTHLKIVHYYCFLVVFAFLIAYSCYRWRRFPVVPAFLLLLCLGNTSVSILGAPTEFFRHFLGHEPFVILMVGLMMSMFTLTGFMGEDRSFPAGKK